MLALGGASGLSPAKMGYAALLLLIVVIALTRLKKSLSALDPSSRVTARAMMSASMVLCVVVLLQATLGLLEGRSVTIVAQDAFTYLLVAISPLVALDAGVGMRLRHLKFIVVSSGVLAASSWSVHWLGRRGSGFDGLERLALPTSFFAFAVFAIALVTGINARRSFDRVLWLSFAIVIVVIYVASGSRSLLVFGLGLIGILGARRFGRLPPWLGVLLVPLILLVAAQFTATFIRFLPDGGRLLDRFTRTFDLLSDSGQGLGADGSFSDRARAYEITWQSFMESPLLGNGFGYLYEPANPSAVQALSLDSPFLILAKFGLIGTFALVVFIISVFRFLSSNRGPSSMRLAGTTLRVFVFIALGRLFFVAPTEDKGFGFSLSLLIVWSIIVGSSDSRLWRTTKENISSARLAGRRRSGESNLILRRPVRRN